MESTTVLSEVQQEFLAKLQAIMEKYDLVDSKLHKGYKHFIETGVYVASECLVDTKKVKKPQIVRSELLEFAKEYKSRI